MLEFYQTFTLAGVGAMLKRAKNTEGKVLEFYQDYTPVGKGTGIQVTILPGVKYWSFSRTIL